MRHLVLIIIYVALLTGCVSNRPDPHLVGHYEAPTGEAIDIQLDGRIVYFFQDKVDFIGMMNVEKRVPTVVHVIAPGDAPLVGTKILFSADNTEIQVQWPTSIQAPNSSQRPTLYYAK